jgi:hypothetical protein
MKSKKGKERKTFFMGQLEQMVFSVRKYKDQFEG